MKRKRDDGDDDYIDPSEKRKNKQPRFNFLTGTAERIIRATAHRSVHFDRSKYNAVFTCRICGRMLGYEDTGGDFYLTNYVYISKKKKRTHKQRALELDHYPKWSSRLSNLQKRGATTGEMRRDYQDENRLRALCRVCNGSHKYEYKKNLPDYDSDDDDFNPRRTPDRELPHNKGSFSGYRDQKWLASF